MSREAHRGGTVNEALLLLVLVWAAFLVPGTLRSRNTSPHVTVGGFERAMDVLRSGSTGPQVRRIVVPSEPERTVEGEPGAVHALAGHRDHDPVVARRLLWFQCSLGAVVASLVLALVLGGWAWWAFVVVLALAVGYAGVLRRLKLQRDQARAVVRELDLTGGEPSVREGPTEIAVGEDEGWSGSPSVRLRRWDA